MGLKTISLIAVILGAALGNGAIAQDAMAPQEVFDMRQHQMRDFGRMMREMRNADGDAMIGAANVYVEGFARLPDLFPEGSIVEGSHALPLIWEDWEGFLAVVDKGNEAAAQLRIAAESGDQAAFMTAARALGPVCQECHDTYRAEME